MVAVFTWYTGTDNSLPVVTAESIAIDFFKKVWYTNKNDEFKGGNVMKELTLTQKILIATGAVVIAGAAAVGVAALIKKRKEMTGEIKELVIDSDEIEEIEEETEE